MIHATNSPYASSSVCASAPVIDIGRLLEPAAPEPGEGCGTNDDEDVHERRVREEVTEDHVTSSNTRGGINCS